VSLWGQEPGPGRGREVGRALAVQAHGAQFAGHQEQDGQRTHEPCGRGVGQERQDRGQAEQERGRQVSGVRGHALERGDKGQAGGGGQPDPPGRGEDGQYGDGGEQSHRRGGKDESGSLHRPPPRTAGARRARLRAATTWVTGSPGAMATMGTPSRAMAHSRLWTSSRVIRRAPVTCRTRSARPAPSTERHGRAVRVYGLA
jgi:hypothetical protein